jgi:hypothetical protein
MSTAITPDAPISEGVDCSRLHYLVYKWAGAPVQRVIARDMTMGRGGWRGSEKSLDTADHLDLIWWTWKRRPERPYGHIGAILLGDNGLLGVIHASETHGHTIWQEMKGVLNRDAVAVKRPLIVDGDVPQGK